MRKAVAKVKAQVPDGQAEDIVAFLTDKITSNATGAGSAEKDATAGMRSVNTWLNAEAATTVQHWARINNSNDVAHHPSFVSVTSKVWKSLKLDASDDDDDTAVQLTLADCVWTFGEAIFDHIPAAVPSIATATVAKIMDAHSKDPDVDLRTVLPTCCHFMCTSSTETITNDVT